MGKIKFFLMIPAVVLSAAVACYPQDQPQPQAVPAQINTFEGQVTAVDWPGGTITVRSGPDAQAEEKIFNFSPDVPVIQGNVTESAGDIDITERVVIRYLQEPDGKLNAVGITSLESRGASGQD